MRRDGGGVTVALSISSLSGSQGAEKSFCCRVVLCDDLRRPRSNYYAAEIFILRRRRQPTGDDRIFSGRSLRLRHSSVAFASSFFFFFFCLFYVVFFTTAATDYFLIDGCCVEQRRHVRHLRGGQQRRRRRPADAASGAAAGQDHDGHRRRQPGPHPGRGLAHLGHPVRRSADSAKNGLDSLPLT